VLCKLTVYTVICVVAVASFASAASPDASTAVAPPSVASPKEIHIDESLASTRRKFITADKSYQRNEEEISKY